MRASIGAVVAVLLAGVLAASGHAAGSTWYVAASGGSDANSCADAAHPCLTINGAIAKAAAGDTVDVAAGTYTGSGTEVVQIAKNLTLSGEGAMIDGENTRIGINVAQGVTATVTGFRVTNSAGAGVSTTGSLTLTSSTIDANNGAGVSISGTSTVSIVNATVVNNVHNGDGAAIVTSNVSPANASLYLTNDTIVGNQAVGGSGGGLYVNSGWNVAIRNTIVWNNGGASGFENVAVRSGGQLNSAGWNIAPGLSETGDAFVDPELGQLQDNGGPTETMEPGPSSPAIDAGEPGCQLVGSGSALTTDQRGDPRPATAFDRCDIGSVEVQPPANDDFANATTLAGTGGTFNGGTNEAGVEAGEPEHAGDQGGASVWFTWTPSVSQTYFFDTTGSSFDTLLAVYTGSSVSALTLRAANDDIAANAGPSRVCFSASAGTAYTIAVDGYDGDMGALTLRWGVKADLIPCPTLPPTVTGIAHVGQLLSGDNGTWANAGAATYQWARCQAEACTNIAGATASTYTATSRDVGVDLRLIVVMGGFQSTSDPTAAVAMAPIAHASNGRIVWTSNRNFPNFQIWSMLPDGSGLQQVTRGSFDTEPAPSPDGTRIAFVGQGGGITLVNPDGSGRVATNVGGTYPSWSPDGSRIAFVDGSGIGVMNADGSDAVDLLSLQNTSSVHQIAWSPDGSEIAFASTDPATGHSDIYAIAADGRGPITDLTNDPANDDFSPSWSPDGTKLLFVRGPLSGSVNDGDLYMMNADGSNQTLIFNGDSSHVVMSGVWSPNNSNVVLYAEFDNGNSELYTIHTDGTAKTQLTFNGNRDEIPSWAAPASYVLSVTRSGSGSGTVTSAPGGISCGGTCTAAFADGTSVTLAASAASGSTFSGWTGPCSGTGSCTVPMIGARSVGATFDAAPSPGGVGGGGGGGGGGGLAADLAVDGSVTPTTANQGETLVWTFHVLDANLGPAVDAYVDFTLSSNLTYVSSTTTRGPGCSLDNGKLHCFLDWLSADASKVTLTITTTVATAGDYAVSATAGQLIPDSNQTNNTALVKASTPPPPPPPPSPPAAAKPVIGAPLASPPRPVAGERFTVTFAVTRSDTGRGLIGGSATASAQVGRTILRRTLSYNAGKAHLSLIAPKKGKGKLLTLKLTIHLAGRATTRTVTYRIH